MGKNIVRGGFKPLALSKGVCILVKRRAARLAVAHKGGEIIWICLFRARCTVPASCLFSFCDKLHVQAAVLLLDRIAQ